MEIGEFITRHGNLARQATGATRFWSVANDGSIWYLVEEWVDEIGYSKEIRRFDGANTIAYPLPFTTVEALSVDSTGKLWAYDGRHTAALDGASRLSCSAFHPTVF